MREGVVLVVITEEVQWGTRLRLWRLRRLLRVSGSAGRLDRVRVCAELWPLRILARPLASCVLPAVLLLPHPLRGRDADADCVADFATEAQRADLKKDTATAAAAAGLHRGGGGGGG